MNLEPWKHYIASLDYDPLFVTVSGAHIYGFPSPDSDFWSICVVATSLPLKDMVGLSLAQ